jgi:hypothetical protein
VHALTGELFSKHNAVLFTNSIKRGRLEVLSSLGWVQTANKHRFTPDFLEFCILGFAFFDHR